MNEAILEDDNINDLPARLARVAIYTRKSNETGGRSKSQSQQEDYCLDTCDRFEFLRENISAYREEEGAKGDWWWKDDEGRNPGPHYRPELTRLVRDIKAGLIDVVVVWKSDRLYRDPVLCAAFVEILKQHNVTYISGHFVQDLSSAEGLYQAVVDAAANRKLRDRVSEDIKRDHNWKARHGMFTRDPSCLGFRSAGLGSQAVVPVWEEIETVRRVFQLFVLGENGSGPMGLCAIAKYCRDNGIRITSGAKKQKAKYDNRVEPSQISSILENCMYVGRWRHAGREYPCERLLIPAQDGSDRLETVVSPALYEAAQERLAQRRRLGKRSLSNEHLLSGLMVCIKCGRSLHVSGRYEKRKNGISPGVAHGRWKCPWSRQGQCEGFGMKMVRESVTNEWVLRELAPLIASQIQETRSAAGREADVNALAELNRRIREIQDAETKKLKDVLGVLDTEQYGRLANQLRCDRQALERQADEIRRRLDALENIAPDICFEDLASLPRAAIKDALSRCIRWIALGKEGVVVHTRLGTYIAATFKKIRTPGTIGPPKIGIDTPKPASVLECLSWFPDPKKFVQGRRDFMGPAGQAMTDEEILPGAFEKQSSGFNGELAITYERLD